MEAIQIDAASGTNDVVVLAADGTRQNRTLKPGCAQGLTAAGTIVAIRIKVFFQAAKKHVAAANLLRA